jgi:acyl-CoA reductase-like NAD-dependent aldehyde dehydrogenase
VALETLDGKPYIISYMVDLDMIHYYTGWAGKYHGKIILVNEYFFSCTCHEPMEVYGQIIRWNVLLQMQSWKLGWALATGKVVVMKVNALIMAKLIRQAIFPPGVVNIVPGFGLQLGPPLLPMRMWTK